MIAPTYFLRLFLLLFLIQEIEECIPEEKSNLINDTQKTSCYENACGEAIISHAVLVYVCCRLLYIADKNIINPK